MALSVTLNGVEMTNGVSAGLVYEVEEFNVEPYTQSAAVTITATGADETIFTGVPNLSQQNSGPLSITNALPRTVTAGTSVSYSILISTFTAGLFDCVIWISTTFSIRFRVSVKQDTSKASIIRATASFSTSLDPIACGYDGDIGYTPGSCSGAIYTASCT